MNKEYSNSTSYAQIEELGNIFNIPIASNSKQVWFIRTSGGDYYDDFRLNNYVAIGWDKIPADWIIKKSISQKQSEAFAGDGTMDGRWRFTRLSEKEFKIRISDLYPNEKRPGLVYGQLNTFYNVMQRGDWIVIPSKSTKILMIGALGDVLHEDIIERKKIPDKEYVNCRYTHKRSVEWIRELPASYDIYYGYFRSCFQTFISSLCSEKRGAYYISKNNGRGT